MTTATIRRVTERTDSTPALVEIQMGDRIVTREVYRDGSGAVLEGPRWLLDKIAARVGKRGLSWAISRVADSGQSETI